MNESFSLKRFSNLFDWQIMKMKPFVFVSIAIALFVYAYLKTMSHYTNSDSFSAKLPLFVFIIVICTNFFKQMTENDTAGSFILLPSSTTEKYLFLLTSTVIIPMVVIIILINGADMLARIFHEVPEYYYFMDMNAYLTLLLVASVTFFIHCLGRKYWTLGLSIVFVSFLIPIGISFFKRKEIIMTIILSSWLQMNQVIYLLASSGITLLLAYIFFKRNEIDNSKIYKNFL